MKIFSKCPTVNISKLNFWLVICIAKNFIWTTLKMIFSIFRFFCTLRFQIYKYCPIITNHTSMESFQMMHKSQFHKMACYDWFCAPGSHIWRISVVCALIFRWVMYEEPNFRGRMYIVERGNYCSHNEWQAQNPNIQSIRRVVNYF